MLKKQKEFRFAFFDVETSQCTQEVGEDGFDFGQHFCTTISLCKVRGGGPYHALAQSIILQVCYLCEDSPISDPCRQCGVRKKTFQYKEINEDQDKVRVNLVFLC